MKDVEVLGPGVRVVDDEVGESGADAAGVVLEGEVERAALLDADGAEREAAFGDGEEQAEEQPALANLRRAGEEPEARADEVLDDPTEGFEDAVLEVVGRVWGELGWPFCLFR